MSERLTDEELAEWSERSGVNMPSMDDSILRALVDEIRERRAADILVERIDASVDFTEVERKALRMFVADCRARYVAPGGYTECALDVIDRLTRSKP